MIKKKLLLIFSCCKQFYYLKLDPRSSNLCLDLKYLDGKRVKKLIKHTTDVNYLGIFFTLTYKMRKGSLMIVSFLSLIPSLCKYFYYLNLDPRSLNLGLDLKYLDQKGVKRLIKHTNRLKILKYILHFDIQNEKRDDKRIFISHLFMLQIVLLLQT